MGFDGILVTALARELNEICTSARIEKINQPQWDELVLRLGTSSGRRWLYYSCNPSHPGLYLIPEPPENPPEPGSFSMLLRKHILGGFIRNVRQRETDRIIEIEVETRDEMQYKSGHRLIAEIMGKHSNLVLVDNQSGRILDAMKRIPLDLSRSRQLLPGLPYEYPPSQGKIPYTDMPSGTLAAILESPDPRQAILANIQGFPPLVAGHLASMEISSALTWYDSFLKMMASGSFQASIYADVDGTPVDFHILPLEKLLSFPPMPCDTVSDAIHKYYSRRSDSDRIRQQSAGLERVVAGAIKKNLLKQKRIREDLLKAEDADRYRLLGELLTASLHLVKPGLERVSVPDYYQGGTVEIPLNSRLTPAKNAQAYYRQYNKAKRSLSEKSRQLEQAEADLAYLESVQAFLADARERELTDAIREELTEAGYLRPNASQQKKKKRKASPSRFPADGGMEIFVGRNNLENDEITFRLASRNDLWFHAKDYPGSHVVLRTEGREPDPGAIMAAARAAAFFSKGRMSDNVPVDMTRVRYVRKIPGAKPGQVTFTHQQTLFVAPGDPTSTQPSGK